MNKLNELLSELRQDIEHISVQHHTGGYEEQQEALKTLFKLSEELKNYIRVVRCNIIPTANDCSAYNKDGTCNGFDYDCPHAIND